MAETPINYGLTTKERVKTRLNITESNFDTLIDRLIASVTDTIESNCNRRFKRTTYTNEVYSVYNYQQKMLPLNNIPVIEVTSAQYRTGLKSSPNWTDFNTDDWEIVGDGASGLLRIWGLFDGVNSMRFTYTAGYLIDFDNAGSATVHSLPFDLSDLAERLVCKLFTRREHEGKLSESFQGSSVTWKELFDDSDKDVMNTYKRLPVFI